MVKQAFSRIPNELLEALYSHGFTRRELCVLLRIIRQTYGWNKERDDMTVQQIADSTNIKRPNVSITLSALVKKRCVLKQYGKYGYVLEINTNYKQWDTVLKQYGRIKTIRRPVLKQYDPRIKTIHTKDNNQNTLLQKTKTYVEPEGPTIPSEKAKASNAAEVFAYWKTVFKKPKSRLSPDRAMKIKARLKEGFSVADLKQAIDGCSKSPFHMGENDTGKKYTNIGLIFRNTEKVEEFMDSTDLKPVKKVKPWANQANSAASIPEARDYFREAEQARARKRDLKIVPNTNQEDKP